MQNINGSIVLPTRVVSSTRPGQQVRIISSISQDDVTQLQPMDILSAKATIDIIDDKIYFEHITGAYLPLNGGGTVDGDVFIAGRLVVSDKNILSELISIYSGISDIRDDIDRMSLDITGINNGIDVIKIDISGVKSSIDTTNDNVAAVTASVVSANNNISAINSSIDGIKIDVSDAKINIAEINENILNINERIDSLHAESSSTFYGVEWDITASSPLLTRIGDMDSHRSLPIQNSIKGCILADDGTVVKYLNPASWSAETLDGSLGQVMVEIPQHYRKFEEEGNMRRVTISETSIDGYHLVPRQYMSAYEASIDRSSGKLCSIVNAGTNYRGGNNQSAWDGTYRSVLGRPVSYLSRTALRTAARLRGAGTQWNLLPYSSHKDIFWLYQIEYANRDSQSAFSAQKTSDGFMQGGLGSGVTTIASADWSAFNGYYPFIPCGITDSFGNSSGETAYTLPTEFTGTIRTVYVPRYRGIENIFGHMWMWADGINFVGYNFYTCENPANFNDTSNTNYIDRGAVYSAGSGYVKTFVFGENGDIAAKTVGGSSATFWCDYWYGSNSTTLRGLILGGRANSGVDAGLGYLYSDTAPGDLGAYYGSRLCFIQA